MQKLKEWFSRSATPETGLIENPEQENDPRNLDYAEIAGGSVEPRPDSFFLSDDGWVLNQGSTASCVAHAWAHVVNYFDRELSPRFIFWKIKTQPKYSSSQLSWGAYMVDGAKCLSDEGSCLYTSAPSEGFTSSDEAYLKFSPTASLESEARRNSGGSYLCVASSKLNELERFDIIRDFLWREKKPVAISVKWFASFNKAKKTKGIVPAVPPSGKSVGHAMCAVGFTKIDDHEYLIVKNSWGPTWGDGGFIYLPKGFTTITSGWSFVPSWYKVELPPRITSKKDANRERANILDFEQWLFAKFPAGHPVRRLAAQKKLVIIKALTYFGWSQNDVIAHLEARVENRTRAKAFSFDLGKLKPV